MNDNKLSIVTITFNSDSTIADTIRSVKKQNSVFEYVIKDGRSSDNTLEIVNSMRDERFVVISKKDEGISDAFNQGIKASAGNIIGIINSDDIIMPGASDKVIMTFNSNPDIDIVYGNCARFKESVGDAYEFRPTSNLNTLDYRFLLYHPAVFIRKEAYEKFGYYDCKYKNAMDYELISRMYFSGAKFLYIDECLCAFREGGTSEVGFERTLKEHKKIALRNGTHPLKVNLYIFKLRVRKFVLPVLNKIGIEYFLRRIIKKQKG